MNIVTIYYDSFKKAKYIGALVAFAFGLALLDQIMIVGIILITLAPVFALYNDGIQINPKDKTFRIFSSRFGIKMGKWKSMSKFTSVLILLKRGTRELVGARGAIATYHDEQIYEVMMATKSHRTQMFLGSFPKEEDAKAFANEMAEMLELKLEKYNPKVSKATKARRR